MTPQITRTVHVQCVVYIYDQQTLGRPAAAGGPAVVLRRCQTPSAASLSGGEPVPESENLDKIQMPEAIRRKVTQHCCCCPAGYDSLETVLVLGNPRQVAPFRRSGAEFCLDGSLVLGINQEVGL